MSETTTSERAASRSSTSTDSNSSSPVTLATASSMAPPGKTASNSNTDCSAESSKEYDQETAASNVRCRSIAVRPPRSRRNRSSRRAAISTGDIDRHRAEASSIANGMPSRRTQISRTASMLAASRTRSGRSSRARVAKRSIASSVGIEAR